MTLAVRQGYTPGILGWCVAEHGRYYAREWGFGAFFEAKVGAGMAEFLGRLDAQYNHLFWVGDQDGPLACLSLDGEDAEQGLTHLHWFIASDGARGKGVGTRLMGRTLAAARQDGFAGIYLTTFAGLDAARRLYEKAGFCLVHEAEDMTWGPRMLEQRFEVRF